MIKVLIVDDSVVFQRILQKAISMQRDMQVVGTAMNGEDALKKINTLKPDLMVLDVEMPKMDGLQTLDEIRRRKLDVGVIMFSTLTSRGADTTIKALSKGAFDFVAKPTGRGTFGESAKVVEEELIPKIRAFNHEKQHSSPRACIASLGKRSTKDHKKGSHISHLRPRLQDGRKTVRKPVRGFRPEAIGIGVSTGGPKALDHVIPNFPAHFRLPVFLVQHMPPVFTTQLAKRLNDKSKLMVAEAQDGETVKGGRVYVAPGDYHMELVSDGNKKVIRLNQKPHENSCRPAVDPLFRSLANTYGSKVVGVIMTGMGRDGLEGCKLLKAKGAYIIVQDKETSVVWGMPRFVTEHGLADRICSLDELTPAILEVAGLHNQMAMTAKAGRI